MATALTLHANLGRNLRAGEVDANFVGVRDAADAAVANAAAALAAVSLVAPSTSYYAAMPTGVAATDQATITAAFASSANVVILQPGTYLLTDEIAWPTGKVLKANGPAGSVTLKRADGSTNDYMFKAVNGAAGIGAEGIVFDANKRGCYSGNVLCGIFSADTGNLASSTKWTDCTFYDTAQHYAVLLKDTSGHRFTRVRFDTALRCPIELVGCSDVGFDSVTWTAYNTAATTPTNPAIRFSCGTSDVPVSKVRFADCTWINTVSDGFAIEAVADIAGRVFHSFGMTNCDLDANYKGGTGISGALGRCTIDNSRWTKGFPNNRCGLELAGDNNVVAGNVMVYESGLRTATYGSVIALTGNTNTGLLRSNKVQGNQISIVLTSNNLNGQIGGISLYCQEDAEVSGNYIRFEVAGTAAGRVNAGVMMGTYGNAGPLRGCKVHDNTVVSTDIANGSGFRLLTNTGANTGISGLNGIDYAVGLEVYNNTARGLYAGITLPSTTVDTSCTMVNNNLAGNGTAISGTAAGTGNTINSTYPR